MVKEQFSLDSEQGIETEKEQKKNILKRALDYLKNNKEDIKDISAQGLAAIGIAGPFMAFMISVGYDRYKQNESSEIKEKLRQESLMLPDTKIYPKSIEFISDKYSNKIRIILPEALGENGADSVVNNNTDGLNGRQGGFGRYKWQVQDKMPILTRKNSNGDKKEYYIEYDAAGFLSTAASNPDLMITPTINNREVGDMNFTVSMSDLDKPNISAIQNVPNYTEGNVYPDNINYDTYNKNLNDLIKNGNNELKSGDRILTRP